MANKNSKAKRKKAEKTGSKRVVSQNKERNMQMIIDEGRTMHVPIDGNRGSRPKPAVKGRKKIARGLVNLNAE